MDTLKPSSSLVNEHHCGNLRHKGMYVMTVPDPDEFTFYDRYDATHGLNSLVMGRQFN